MFMLLFNFNTVSIFTPFMKKIAKREVSFETRYKILFFFVINMTIWTMNMTMESLNMTMESLMFSGKFFLPGNKQIRTTSCK